MLELEDMLTLQNEGRPVPYLTGGEAAILLSEIKRLRAVVTSLEQEGVEGFMRGATAMQEVLVACLTPSYDSGAAGMVRAFDAKTLLPKAFGES